ncbi:hypothetical protein APHAL10511_005309 [Amanita phalloides]|nr:hypothetical protein APHAL10511_005309 [Amanita phalloides]
MPRSRRSISHAAHLFAFFAEYSDFNYDPRAPVLDEFHRLVRVYQWKPESKERKEARTRFSAAMGRQFSSFYGTRVDDLAAWQALCLALGVDPVPETVDECRKIIKSTHVNLVDFIDTRLTGVPVKTFETEEKLREYTLENRKFFPKQSAKESGVLKYLLREILA